MTASIHVHPAILHHRTLQIGECESRIFQATGKRVVVDFRTKRLTLWKPRPKVRQ